MRVATVAAPPGAIVPAMVRWRAGHVKDAGAWGVHLDIVDCGRNSPATAVAWQTDADCGRVWVAATLPLAPF